MRYKICHFLETHKAVAYLIKCLLVFGTVLGSCFLLQYSTFDWIGLGGTLSFLCLTQYGWLNLMTMGAFLAALMILCNRLWLSCLISSLVSGVLSIINYYVLQFHGMPLSFLILRNFKTAMNVAGTYSFELDFITVRLAAGMVALLCMCLAYRIFFDRKRTDKGFPWVRDAALAVGCAAVFFAGYFGSNPVKPVKTLTWDWKIPYAQYGYLPCTVESLVQMFNIITEPDGYAQETVNDLSAAYMDAPDEERATPDIILIVNETFYDLRQVADIETDIPFMGNIETMENLLRGYAVSPMDVGGTNCTEYELLTSNSMQLMPGVTPFNTIGLQNAHSIVSHLNALGYSTLGTHSEMSSNYSRGVGYSALGFQTSYFDDAYQDVEFYHYRSYASDESVYRNLIRWYEEAPEDAPRFQYLLTMQNHGGWAQNKDKYDLVHTRRDYGDNTSVINEFLTCIYQSDMAFKKLTDYFALVDRPVIVCMVGDHSTTFAEDIAEERYSGQELTRRLRTVPLLIWANYPLEQRELGTMSMNMVVPTLLDIANVKLSPYYRYMLEVKEQTPILMATGDYYDAQGNMYSYDSDEGMPYQELVDNYFNLEYQNIATERNRDFYSPDAD